VEEEEEEEEGEEKEEEEEEECRSNVHFGDSLTTHIIDINLVSYKCPECLDVQSQKNGR
jgi:hypothetical protein